ncbi:MAG: hypothetical protein JST65_03070 [Acidobacteria bacterium]|nr:hypothetical protein [Acidobacteriota bacterium]
MTHPAPQGDGLLAQQCGYLRNLADTIRQSSSGYLGAVTLQGWAERIYEVADAITRQRDEAEAKVTACAKLIRHLRHRAATGELSHGRLWCDGVRFSANQLETIIGTDENDG